MKYSDIMIFICIAFVVGATFGWCGRMLSTRDILLVATAQRYDAEREYLNKQAQAIIQPAITRTRKGAQGK